MHHDIKRQKMRLLLITKFTLQEVIRRRLFLVIVILTLLLLVLFVLLFSAVLQVELANPDVNPQVQFRDTGMFLTLPTMWIVYLQCSIMTIFLTVGMISSEVEAGTFSVIVPKPLKRI